LKFAQHEVSFRDIEEIDLADEPLKVESAYTASRQYPPTPGVLSIEGKNGSVTISKKVPQFAYENGLQQNFSLIGYFDHDDRSSPDFPLPSTLLGNEDPFEHDLKQDLEPLFPTLSNAGFELSGVTDTAAIRPIESFEGNSFHFNAFKVSETAAQVHNASSNKKRLASPSLVEPEAKIRRVVLNDEASKPMEGEELPQEAVASLVQAKKPLPDWVAEFDQDLIAFFGDSVEYKD
jgi:hypothetical protein